MTDASLEMLPSADDLRGGTGVEEAGLLPQHGLQVEAGASSAAPPFCRSRT